MSTNLPKIAKANIIKKFGDEKDMALIGKTIELGMSMFGTDMNRATHYNTKEEQVAASAEIHNRVFDLDRSIYGCLMCIPGTTDISKMKAVSNMLGKPWKHENTVLDMDAERKIIDLLVSELPANRMINLFVSFTDNKINNKRTLKTVLPFILNSDNLEWWSVKYRRKLKNALSHCWGKQMTSAIIKILGKKRRIAKEHEILKAYISSHLVRPISESVFECIAFIFGAWEIDRFTMKLFKNFYASRFNFALAKGLPKEVIEGIRASCHPNIDKAETLEVAKKSMTSKERKLVQKQASKSGVKVDWDPMSQTLTDLIIYGFKMGFDKIYKYIGIKAAKAATALPFRYNHVGIICDDSFSMSGSDDQKLRALATTYGTTAMLENVGKVSTVITVSGRGFSVDNKPVGETNLGQALIRMLKAEPDVIFVVSDGYENAPEGRFDEVLKIAREKLNIITPVYHFNPVAAAESKVALKRLSDNVPITPVSNPEKMGLTLFKTMLSIDPRAGMLELFNMILPKLETTQKLYARSDIHALVNGNKSLIKKVKEA